MEAPDSMSSSSPQDQSRPSPGQSGGTAGVQELIDRLKTEGVQEGQHQAESLLGEAKKQAAEIVDAARAEADTIVKEAQQRAERTETNGKRALALASRDASLHFGEQLQHEFRGWIGRLVAVQLGQPEFLAELIREMAVGAMASAGGGHRRIQDDDPQPELKFLVAEDEQASVDKYVKGQAAEMLRQGVSLAADRSLTHGFRVQIVGDDIEINFSDEAVTAALMRFLAPKFRQQIGSASEDE
jgi:V/A-type H+-transporting ATPase subunit E